VRFTVLKAGLLVLLRGVAAGCCFSVLSEWGVPSGACMLVLLQGAAAGYRCRVLLQGASVRVACALWSWHVGAALEPLQKAVCILETWMLLQGAVRVRCAL